MADDETEVRESGGERRDNAGHHRLPRPGWPAENGIGGSSAGRTRERTIRSPACTTDAGWGKVHALQQRGGAEAADSDAIVRPREGCRCRSAACHYRVPNAVSGERLAICGGGGDGGGGDGDGNGGAGLMIGDYVDRELLMSNYRRRQG